MTACWVAARTARSGSERFDSATSSATFPSGISTSIALVSSEKRRPQAASPDWLFSARIVSSFSLSRYGR